jgi:hypothetical protein
VSIETGFVGDCFFGVIIAILFLRKAHMLKAFCRGYVFACVGLFAVSLHAQQVVHALTGTISGTDELSKTLIVFQDNGTEGEFKDMTSGKSRVTIDKKIALGTSSAEANKKKGTYVIVFYYGDSSDRTVVALKNLGSGPFTSSEGTVTKFEGKQHSITLQDSSGATQTFKIAENTVAEGYMGAIDGYRFQPSKGDHVRVVGTTDNGAVTALFMKVM